MKKKPGNITKENSSLLNEENISLNSMPFIFSPNEGRFERITDLACKFFQVNHAKISLNESARKWFSETAFSGEDEKAKVYFCGYAINSKEPVIISDTTKFPDFSKEPLVLNEPGIRFYAGYPLNFEGTNLGTLCLMDNEPRHLKDNELDILKDLAALVEDELRISKMDATQADLMKQLDDARREALIDHLTESWNRRAISQVLPSELERSIRNNTPVTVMMVDIDHFKEINDTYGHDAGDLVIKEVSRQIKNTIRPHDILIRYGGDEFLLFFEDTTEETGSFLGKRILNQIKKTQIQTCGLSLQIDISIGITSLIPDKNTEISEIIKTADAALYCAKKEGKACARIHTFG
ncbi:MAG: sensor domain-containing diguanylate cyclase [Spirochaetia bacterium]|nr:sensor domain-containing diguanylate cyclase [Spirochaetia bacterium]